MRLWTEAGAGVSWRSLVASVPGRHWWGWWCGGGAQTVVLAIFHRNGLSPNILRYWNINLKLGSLLPLSSRCGGYLYKEDIYGVCSSRHQSDHRAFKVDRKQQAQKRNKSCIIWAEWSLCCQYLNAEVWPMMFRDINQFNIYYVDRARAGCLYSLYCNIKCWIRNGLEEGSQGSVGRGALGVSIGVSCEHLLSFISAVLISAINLNLPPLHISQPEARMLLWELGCHS